MILKRTLEKINLILTPEGLPSSHRLLAHIVFAGICLLTSLLLQANNDNSDPNGYFKDRNWNLKYQKNSVTVTSKYQSEPAAKPNWLNAHLRCHGKHLNILKDYKYCGLDSIRVVGSYLELMLVDYDVTDPNGYCRIKRTHKVRIPNCPKK